MINSINLILSSFLFVDTFLSLFHFFVVHKKFLFSRFLGFTERTTTKLLSLPKNCCLQVLSCSFFPTSVFTTTTTTPFLILSEKQQQRKKICSFFSSHPFPYSIPHFPPRFPFSLLQIKEAKKIEK